MHPNEQFPHSFTASLGALIIRVVLPLIGVVLLTTGLLGVVSYGVLPTIESLRSYGWAPVEATIESVSLSPPVSRLHPQLDTVEIRYRYVVGGAEYSNVRYDPHAGLYRPQESAAVIADLRTSPQITVWVDPDNPNHAMVLKGLRLPVLMFVVPALGLAVVGGLMLFAGMLSWNHNHLTWRPGARES